eukprot:scaffold5464_cov97-Skeletonema_dohrnii-CCMP3373.AAC.5
MDSFGTIYSLSAILYNNESSQRHISLPVESYNNSRILPVFVLATALGAINHTSRACVSESPFAN